MIPLPGPAGSLSRRYSKSRVTSSTALFLTEMHIYVLLIRWRSHRRRKETSCLLTTQPAAEELIDDTSSMSQTDKNSDSRSSNEKSNSGSVADVENQLVRQLKNRHIAMIRRVEIQLVWMGSLSWFEFNYIFCSKALEVLSEQVFPTPLHMLHEILTISRSLFGNCRFTTKWRPCRYASRQCDYFASHSTWQQLKVCYWGIWQLARYVIVSW